MKCNKAKTILNWQVSLHAENIKILKRNNQEVVYDKRKEHANGNSLSEYDWNSGKKDALRFID